MTGALSVLVFGGPCTLGGLAATEYVAAPTMTRIVDGLERLGLATRAAHPDSARQVLISPTEAGTDLMLQAADRRVAVIVGALRTMPTDQRRAIVTAAPSLRELSSRVAGGVRDRSGR